MWVFYVISLPLTMGMVLLTLMYFAGPDVPRYVLFIVGYTWFCSISVIILVPADMWAGYEDAGDYTVTERLKTSVHANLVFHLCVGSIALCGLILLIILRSNWDGGILGFAMACSNTFGLVTGAFLLGFGLSEIPKGLWRSADWITRQKVLSHKVAKMAVKLDDAHQEFSNAIVVAQATSKQMSRRDPLRPYLNIIDKMLLKMLSEDPTFKPQGGKLGENDMDYDTNEKTMAQLRRQLKRARERYYRYKRKYISSFRTERAGTLGSFFDMIELVWRCILNKLLEKLFSIILGCMSAAILLAEVTILPSGVDLSLFSILINTVDRHEVLVQVARYAAPISYNFLNLIRLPRDAKDSKTIFEKRMGNIDDAVPFFGKGFNKIYPLIIVIYTIMITSNFFCRVISYFGNWKIFRHQNEEAEDLDGFDPSGLIILNKERSWLEQGHKVGELVIPLARNFNNTNTDLESASNSTVSGEAKANTSLIEDGKNSYSKFHTADSQHHIGKENTGRKYTAIRTQPTPEETSLNSSQNTTFTEASRDAGDTQDTTILPQSGVSATWQSMKMGFQNFKANIGAVKFLPLRESQENTKHSQVTSSESLDEILEKLKRPAPDHSKYSSDDDLDLDDYVTDIKKSDSSR